MSEYREISREKKKTTKKIFKGVKNLSIGLVSLGIGASSPLYFPQMKLMQQLDNWSLSTNGKVATPIITVGLIGIGLIKTVSNGIKLAVNKRKLSLLEEDASFLQGENERENKILKLENKHLKEENMMLRDYYTNR